MLIYIYALADPLDGRIRYVGKSTAPVKRLARHLEEARNGSALHSRLWISKLIKRGAAPELMVIDMLDSNEKANDAERWWIKKLTELGADLTNRTPGGDGQPKGYRPSRESVEKARVKLRGQKRASEQRARMRQAFNTPAVRARRRQIVEELKCSNPEWLARVRRGRTGIPNSLETIERMRAAWTPSRREAQSERLKGTPISDRHRAQLRAALQIRWEKYKEAKS